MILCRLWKLHVNFPTQKLFLSVSCCVLCVGSFSYCYKGFYLILCDVEPLAELGNLTETMCVSGSVASGSLQSHGRGRSTRFLCPWNSPGKNTGVGRNSLHQGIFLTLGLNPGLLQCRQILYQLSHQGSPAETVFSFKKWFGFFFSEYFIIIFKCLNINSFNV